MDLELDEILVQVNRMLVKDLEHGHFVTLALARLDVSRRSLIYAGAGHMPGFVLDDAGLVVHVLESNGPPLGLFPDSKFSCQNEILLEPGQIVVLLTDGITESVGSRRGGIWRAGSSGLHSGPLQRVGTSNLRRSSLGCPKIRRPGTAA
jgi:serine phosphatase RsbU (regulator of sigma subunit)